MVAGRILQSIKAIPLEVILTRVSVVFAVEDFAVRWVLATGVIPDAAGSRQREPQ